MQKNPSSQKVILLLVLLAGVVALGWFVVSSVNNTIDRTLSPFKQANDQLSTQVSQLLHPTSTVIPDPVTIINEVRAVAKLETIHYTVEKVVTAETNQGILALLFGDRLLFVGHGYVIAGVDMAKIGMEDMWLQDGILNVRLPKTEIFVATLDNDQSYVYDREVGILTNPDPDLETLARQVAEQEILNAALEDGILDQARLNAEVFLERFFNALGYEHVIFVQIAP
jgi:hypothetical protein